MPFFDGLPVHFDNSPACPIGKQTFCICSGCRTGLQNSTGSPDPLRFAMFDNRKLAFSQTMLNHWTIVPILVLLFLGLNLAIGLLAARGHVKSTADHVVGGRSLSGP